jgi:hypothetical protein
MNKRNILYKLFYPKFKFIPKHGGWYLTKRVCFIKFYYNGWGEGWSLLNDMSMPFNDLNYGKDKLIDSLIARAFKLKRRIRIKQLDASRKPIPVPPWN